MSPQGGNTNISTRLVPNLTFDDPQLWQRFKEYLLTYMTKDSANDRLNYARRYCYVLVEGNASEIINLQSEKRNHVMKGLSTFSKFLGCYDNWKYIREKYQLKWSNEYSLDIFSKYFDSESSIDSMLTWIKNVYRKMPHRIGNIILFCTLTGLRPDEACKSVEVIHQDLDHYLNKKHGILEHFKYPEIFIRRTKKAYISFVSDRYIKIARGCEPMTYNSVRLNLKRNLLPMNMNYCRKIFATHLRTSGIEQETIDFLQGRVPRSVFARHYFRPDFKNDQRIINALDELYKMVTK